MPIRQPGGDEAPSGPPSKRSDQRSRGEELVLGSFIQRHRLRFKAHKTHMAVLPPDLVLVKRSNVGSLQLVNEAA